MFERNLWIEIAVSYRYDSSICHGNHYFVMIKNGASLTNWMFLLRLLATRKALQQAMFFFLSFSLQHFWMVRLNFFACVLPDVVANACDQYRTYFVDALANSYVYVLNFRVCEHDLPCALQINSNSGFEQACKILFCNY